MNERTIIHMSNNHEWTLYQKQYSELMKVAGIKVKDKLRYEAYLKYVNLVNQLNTHRYDFMSTYHKTEMKEIIEAYIVIYSYFSKLLSLKWGNRLKLLYESAADMTESFKTLKNLGIRYLTNLSSFAMQRGVLFITQPYSWYNLDLIGIDDSELNCMNISMKQSNLKF